MKTVVLTTVCILAILSFAQAGGKGDWQEYSGRYIVSAFNAEETVEIALQADSTLTAFSSLGEVRLTYVEKDRFEVPQYGGVVIFERDEAQQVIACKISVAAVDLQELKARKL
ncbi:MAG: hypothetical protein LBF08_04455 [Dysgonamonadaceae bacterium]|jgi:hypothetical protein|nr:hypothetical protein [Dysgonamonadaceae bacterium]